MSSEDLIREAGDPATSAARLAEIAQADRSTWATIAAHPQAYEGLLDWLGEHGDDSVRAAIASRAAAIPPPPPPPAPEAVAPPAPPAAPEPVVTEPVPAASPTPAVEHTTVLPTTEPVAAGSADEAAPVAETSTASDPAPKKSAPAWVPLAIIAALVAIAAAGYFGVTAVFGDDDDDSTPVAAKTTAKDQPTAGASDEQGGDPDAASGDFCASFKDLQKESTSLLGSSTSGAPDLSEVQANVAKITVKYQTLAAIGPDEIKPELKTMADYFSSLRKLSSGGTPSTAQNDIAELSKASQKVTAYYYTNCNS